MVRKGVHNGGSGVGIVEHARHGEHVHETATAAGKLRTCVLYILNFAGMMHLQ